MAFLKRDKNEPTAETPAKQKPPVEETQASTISLEDLEALIMGEAVTLRGVPYKLEHANTNHLMTQIRTFASKAPVRA